MLVPKSLEGGNGEGEGGGEQGDRLKELDWGTGEQSGFISFVIWTVSWRCLRLEARRSVRRLLPSDETS